MKEEQTICWEHRRQSPYYRGRLGEHLIGTVMRFRGRRWRVCWISVKRPNQEVKSLTVGKAMIEQEAAPPAEGGA